MQLDAILTELSRNNELPTETKLQETRELHSQVNEDLVQIDAEIERLKAKREDVQRSLDIYDTILSPARRLLPDILQEIFYHCLSSDGPIYAILSASEVPMLLTRVCSLWRSVALSSPRIWTSLHIPIPGDPRIYGFSVDRSLELRRQMFSKTMQLRCRAINEWLDRSGSCPLSLSISYPFSYSPDIINNGAEDDEVVDPLLRTIQPFAPRLRHLHLSMPHHIYQKLETKIPLDSLSTLRSFEGNIFFPSATPGPQPTLVPLHIIELPTLKALSISCPQITLNLPNHPNSWGRLTDICFESPALDTDLIEMLKQCRNLITLDVNMQIPRARLDGLEPTFEMVLLPQLKNLKLRETGRASAALCAINAPHLKSLLYKCPHRYVGDGWGPSSLSPSESLPWLISNAAASLETLSIDPRTFQPEQVLQCLRLATHVKDLILGEKPYFFPTIQDPEQYIGAVDIFDLEVFTVRTTEDEFSTTTPSIPLQSDILLPNLESLEANNFIIADENLRRILISRIDAAHRGLTSPLRHVKIQFERQQKKDIVPEIVARSRSVGLTMKLDLVFRPPGPNVGPLCPSFLVPGHCYTII